MSVRSLGDDGTRLLVLVKRHVRREILAATCRALEALADFMHSSQVVGQGAFTIERFVAEQTNRLG